MKRKLIWTTVILALIAAVSIYWFYLPKPTIQFVRFETEKEGRVAVFRIENNTNEIFAYNGLPNEPFYQLLIQSPSGWERQACLYTVFGSGYQQMNPKEFFEFRKSISEREAFRIGITFERGTAEETKKETQRRLTEALSKLKKQPTLFNQLMEFVYEYLPRGMKDQYVWSDPVQP
jgi:hypothetical protein